MSLVNVVNVGDPFGHGKPWYMHYCGNCGHTLNAGIDKSCEKCGELVEYPSDQRIEGLE